MTSKNILAFVFLQLSLVAPSASAEESYDYDAKADPWRGMNEVTQKFNNTADKYFLRPVARGYQAILPGFVRTGIRNFFSNLGDIDNSANNFLQGKVGDGLEDIARLTVNTTIGLGGLFDPATRMGLVKHPEDFGQTLSVWGVPKGPYLVLPLLGPSTVTDAVSRPFDSSLNPVRFYKPVRHRNVLFAVDVVQAREGLLGVEKAMFGDQYLFFRDAYLQRREYLVNDGEVVETFDDGF